MTPPLVSSIAIAEGDLSEVDDLPLHSSTIDAGVLLLLRSQRPNRVLIVIENQLTTVSWQSLAEGLFNLGAKVI